MGRTVEGPWYRNSTSCYMCTIAGKQFKLLKAKENPKNKKLAWQKYHEMMLTAVDAPGTLDMTVLSVSEHFLDWASDNLNPRTYKDHKWFHQRFCEHCGNLKVNDLKVFHVTQWLKKETTWKETTCYNARRSVKRAFKWAVDEEILQNSPLAKLKVGRGLSRSDYMSQETYIALRRAACRPMKIFLFALWQTGARPGELCDLTWDNVLDTHFCLKQHKTCKVTRKPRIIFLTEPMQRLTGFLKKSRGDSKFVFLNTRRQKWTANSAQSNLRRLAKKLDIKAAAYPYATRHAFGTGALEQGIDVVTVAQLMGHSSVDMLNRVYAHLSNQHLAKAANDFSRRRMTGS